MDGHHSRQNEQSLEKEYLARKRWNEGGLSATKWEIVHVWLEAASFLRLLRICTHTEGGEQTVTAANRARNWQPLQPVYY
jgi:hypothetical protein